MTEPARKETPDAPALNDTTSEFIASCLTELDVDIAIKKLADATAEIGKNGKSYNIRNTHTSFVKGNVLGIIYGFYRDTLDEPFNAELTDEIRKLLTEQVKFFDETENLIETQLTDVGLIKAHYDVLVQVAFEMGNIIGHTKLSDPSLPTKRTVIAEAQAKLARQRRAEAGKPKFEQLDNAIRQAAAESNRVLAKGQSFAQFIRPNVMALLGKAENSGEWPSVGTIKGRIEKMKPATKKSKKTRS